MPDDEITDAMRQDAIDGLSKVTVAGRSAELMSADDRIKLANHSAAQDAGSVLGFGLRSQKIVPPGC